MGFFSAAVSWAGGQMYKVSHQRGTISKNWSLMSETSDFLELAPSPWPPPRYRSEEVLKFTLLILKIVLKTSCRSARLSRGGRLK